MRTFSFAMLAVVAMALLGVASAQQRALLQDAAPAAPAIPGMGWYPGQFAGQFAGLGAQYYNPQFWTSLYSQAIPYDMYANWVNGNTDFNLPLINLPGLPQGGST